MKLRKAFKHALTMVLHSKLRSWLTILGIVIGVAAVISIVALGNALEEEIDSQLGNLGGDLVTLRAGASRAFGFGPGRPDEGGGSATTEEIVLDKTDVQALKGISDIKVMDTEISGRVDVYYLAKKGTVSVTGVDPAAWYQITTTEIAEGRTLGPADTNVIVIGGKLASDFFEQQLGVNQLITVDDKLFRIVGILDDESTSITMPISAAYEIIDDKERDVYDQIIIKVKNEEELDTAIQNIREKLIITRHAPKNKPDFTISSNKERQEQRAEMMSSMTTFLTALAAVALLVGAVGIANTMFTSVLEKTKEIGIMKAIGARNSDILKLFLLNAALIGFMGGLLGILLGAILSGILPALLGGMTFGRMGAAGAALNPQIVIVALSLSVFLGMISGAVPAYQASRLKPVDALRYE